MQLRYQVAGSDINKSACGKRQKEDRKITDISSNKISRYRPQDTGEGSEKIIIKRLKLAETPVDQDSEVAYLLRDLMQYNYQGSDNPKMYAQYKTGADNQAVSKIMDTIADKIKVGKGVDRADALMAMAPMQVFLQDKKGDKA